MIDLIMERFLKEGKCIFMSNKEFAKSLIDQIPESRQFYVISYLQGAAVPDETPNADTLAAFQELAEGGCHMTTPYTKRIYS